jgi:hypothetical protein
LFVRPPLVSLLQYCSIACSVLGVLESRIEQPDGYHPVRSFFTMPRGGAGSTSNKVKVMKKVILIV